MISRKTIGRSLRHTTFGLGLVVTLNPTSMAGGHHQKGQLIAVPVAGVAAQPAQMSYVQPVQVHQIQPAQLSYVQPVQVHQIQPVQMSYVQPTVQMSYGAQPMVHMSYAQPQAPPPQQSAPTVHITVVEAPAPPPTLQAAPPTPQTTPQVAYAQPQASYAPLQAAYAPPQAVYAQQPQSAYQAFSAVGLQGAIPVQLYQVPKQHGLFNHFQKQKVLIAR